MTDKARSMWARRRTRAKRQQRAIKQRAQTARITYYRTPDRRTR